MNWRDIYVLGEIFGCRFIIRNQWHRHTSSSAFEVVKISFDTMRDRKEAVLSIFGFSFVVMADRLLNSKP